MAAALEPIEIGLIGGTGVYALDALENVQQIEVSTPYGLPSGPITIGTLNGIRCCFLARHGYGHKVLPSEVNYRANIFALAKLGVKYLITFSACGSLKEELHPGDIMLIDQFIDRTKTRQATFFGDGIVGHVAFGEPTDKSLTKLLEQAIREATPDVKLTVGGTYVCMEGPAFSTKAESNLYRSWGASVIGMTTLTEAKLAREAEIAYVGVALVTDYDCWKDEEHVTADSVIQVLKRNANNVQKIVMSAIRHVAAARPTCEAHTALATAIMTPPENISAEKKREMFPIFGKYIPLEVPVTTDIN